MSTPKSRFQGLFEPPAKQPISEPEERKEEIKKSRKRGGTVPRVKTNYEIRQDYVQTIKRIALDEQRKIYEVIEEALAEYLKRHQETKA